MTQSFNSRKKIEKPWLSSIYNSKKNRTYELGKKSIDLLLQQEIKISYRKIVEKSKEIDNEKKGIHANSIKNNSELYKYYKENVPIKTKTRKSLKASFKEELSNKEYNQIKPDRNIEALRYRYLKFEKKELVELLIKAEQYIAENNQRWVISQFENFKK
jgi:hypothetical protein